MDALIDRIVFFIPVLLSLTVHEWAHAWTAMKLGDDTAKLMGRVSLNPIDHIDPLGTLLLPLMGVPFGWAKPVPFNPVRFRTNISMPIGTLLVAIAGPISNFVLGIGSAAGLVVLGTLESHLPYDIVDPTRELLVIMILVNFLLGLFNLLPIPPLDGSKVVDGLLPRRWRPVWNQLCSVGPFLLVAVIVLPFLMGVSLFAWPLSWVQRFVAALTS